MEREAHLDLLNSQLTNAVAGMVDPQLVWRWHTRYRFAGNDHSVGTRDYSERWIVRDNANIDPYYPVEYPVDFNPETDTAYVVANFSNVSIGGKAF